MSIVALAKYNKPEHPKKPARLSTIPAKPIKRLAIYPYILFKQACCLRVKGSIV
jgi:hypothetical protein